jgi:hypothetical protein
VNLDLPVVKMKARVTPPGARVSPVDPEHAQDQVPEAIRTVAGRSDCRNQVVAGIADQSDDAVKLPHGERFPLSDPGGTPPDHPPRGTQDQNVFRVVQVVPTVIEP